MTAPIDRVDAVVLGCGYVGLELVRLFADRDLTVAGVRRSAEGLDAIEAAGGIGLEGDVTDPASLAELPDADWVVFAASAGRGGVEAARETYLRGIERTIEAYADRNHRLDRLLYTSSTGVYGDHDGDWVDEETPIDPKDERARVLYEAERRVLEGDVPGTVVRFGGLYGPDRYRFDRYLDRPVTEGVLNSTHRDDAAGAIAYLLEEGFAEGQVVLVVDDEPVEKWTFADWLADQCDRPAPPKLTKEERLERDDLSAGARRRILADKRCSNDRIRSFGYELQYPTIRDGHRPAIPDRC